MNITEITITKEQLLDLALTLGSIAKHEAETVNADSIIAQQAAEQVIEQLNLEGKVGQDLFWSNFNEAGGNRREFRKSDEHNQLVEARSI